MSESSKLDLVVEELTAADWDQLVDGLVGDEAGDFGVLDVQGCGGSCGCGDNNYCFGDWGVDAK
jgi:hypothetical protein